MSYLIPRREIDFILHDWLRLDEILSLPDFGDHGVETIAQLMDLSERLAIDQFLPHYREADVHEPRLEGGIVLILPAAREALAQYRDLGLFAASFAPELGGMGLPTTVCLASFAQFLAANASTAAYILLTNANARVIAAFGTEAQIAQFALPQIEGRWFGTMCLSEPEAGSGLGDITTRAVPDGDDPLGARYRLTGNKMWISGGNQDVSENIVHLVLAKTQGPEGQLAEGTRGISLFLVPKVLPDGGANDVTVAALNHKMGYRGTSNCALNFGEAGGAIGWLVGQEGDGLRQMFQMMNEARISVGLGAAALAWRGYRHAAEYAQQRTQGRRAGEAGNRKAAIIEHADVRHMLLTQKAIAEGALAVCLYCAILFDRAQHDTSDTQSAILLDLLTPVAKTWPSEMGLVANHLAIQIHGGYGYTRDFPVEQVYRDQRLNPIHEGTTGIQGIDLVGRKIVRDEGRALQLLEHRIRDTISRSRKGGLLTDEASAIELALDQALAAACALIATGMPKATENATAFLNGFGHLVIGWLLLDQALVIGDAAKDDAFAQGKLHSCRYFARTELPKAGLWFEIAVAGSALAAACRSEIFG